MSRQLQFEFAEILPRSDERGPHSELSGPDFSWLKSKARKTNDIGTAAADTSRLLEEVLAERNLSEALLHVARNKGAAGVDGQSVEKVVARAEKLLPRLRTEILGGRYRPLEVKRVWIPKPGSDEPRGLGIPAVSDRWLQQAIHQVLSPIFEPTFHHSSHGFRPNRGAQTAIAEAKALVNDGYEWVVSLDLSKFFDRVNHQRLLSRLGQSVKDKGLLHLIHQMLKAKIVLPDGTKVSVDEGTPQGGPLSPLLSNIVLDELDWELERRGLRFVRYADDLNVFVRSERAGARVMAGLTRFVEKRLRLKVNHDKSVVDRPENVHILGFSLHRNPTKGLTEVRLSKKTRRRIRSKVLELTPRNWGQSIRACMQKANQYLEGWIGYFRQCSSPSFLEGVDSHLRRRLRAIIIRHRKRPRHLYRHLVRQGAPKHSAAKLAFSSRGIWFKSNMAGINLAYKNRWFMGKLINLEHKWSVLNTPLTAAASEQLILAF